MKGHNITHKTQNLQTLRLQFSFRLMSNYNLLPFTFINHAVRQIFNNIILEY